MSNILRRVILHSLMRWLIFFHVNVSSQNVRQGRGSFAQDFLSRLLDWSHSNRIANQGSQCRITIVIYIIFWSVLFLKKKKKCNTWGIKTREYIITGVSGVIDVCSHVEESRHASFFVSCCCFMCCCRYVMYYYICRRRNSIRWIDPTWATCLHILLYAKIKITKK